MGDDLDDLPQPGDLLAGFPGYQGMDLAALRRYVVGRSPEPERRRIMTWALESADRRRYLEALRALYERDPLGSTDHRPSVWGRVASHLEPPASTGGQRWTAPWDGPPVTVDLTRPSRPRILAGAFRSNPRRSLVPITIAAVVVLSAAGFYMVQRTAEPESVPRATPMRRVATTRGQRAEIRLDDGTRVVLGVESRLEFSADFGSTTRDVYLDGTADFQVVPDTTRPFTVHTANAVTRDVGTQFVVRAYPTEHRTEVVVTEGSVELGAADASPGREALLTSNQLGILDAGASAVSVRRVDPTAYTAWMHGRLAFRDTPLSAVVRELGRWYATPVRLGDPALGTMPFTASFDVESLPEAVATLTAVLPLRAVRRAGVVILLRK
jgi:transmembrane sensor